KNGGDCRPENRSKATKGDLLLRVSATELEPHRVGHDPRISEGFLNIGRHRAEIAAFYSCGHRDHLLQVLTGDFRLAADRDEVGDPLQREKVSVKRANQKIGKITVRSARCRRRPDSNTDFGSSANSLTSIGCGTEVRSPIKSSINCAISKLSPGTSWMILARTSAMTSSMGRRGPGLRRTKKSPLFGSARSPPRPAPVRRDVVATSGVAARVASTWRTSRSVSDRAVPGGVREGM